MAASGVPPCPPGTRASGKALWRDVLGRFDLDGHEMALLKEAVRQIDTLDLLAAAVARDGAVVTGPDGALRTHPALIEARQGRLALARVLGALRLPDEQDVRGRRRTGVRRPYAVRPA